MVEIVSVILAEYEPVPFILLELLFARIIDPEKVTFFSIRCQSKSKIFFVLEITWRMLRSRFVDYSSMRIVSQTGRHRSSFSSFFPWTTRPFLVFQSDFNQRRYGFVSFTRKNLLYFRRIVSNFWFDCRRTDSNDRTSFNRKENLVENRSFIFVVRFFFSSGFKWKTSTWCSKNRRLCHECSEKWFRHALSKSLENFSWWVNKFFPPRKIQTKISVQI